MASDGQMTLGDIVFKKNAKKVRKIYGGNILAGFSGATADALALVERFEGKLKEFGGNLFRAAVELAKDWRMDRALRQLSAMLLVADKENILVISGNGDVVQPDEPVAAIGSGGPVSLAVAKALIKYTDLPPEEIAKEAIILSGEISIYSNTEICMEVLP